jgi:ubiquinone/menaquinone biosynthesis C-methylase UbiE
MENDKFAKKAGSWDNPQRTAMADVFVKEIQKNIKIEKDFEILEFGCGTGSVGLSFTDAVKKIRMVDDSESMLAILKEKITLNNIPNVEIFHGSIEDYKTEPVDLIFSSMAFHHVSDITNTISTFHKILLNSGYVVISDLKKEDGSFHAPDVVPHNGFDLEELRDIFVKCGFSVNKIYVYNRIIKQITSGENKEYEQFILIAQKA